MNTGEIYKFAANTDHYRLFLFETETDAILEQIRKSKAIGVGQTLNGKIFTVIDCKKSIFEDNILIIQVMFESKKYWARYNTDQTLHWNQLKQVT